MHRVTIFCSETIKCLTQVFMSSVVFFGIITFCPKFGTSMIEAQSYNLDPYVEQTEANPMLHLLYYGKSNILPTSDLTQQRNYSRGRKGLIYGGKDHKQFLGCIGCGTYSSDSICNTHGSYGSKYSQDGLFNKYSTFGSKYSQDSPWNSYSSTRQTPILVDEQGRFYGYFTSNPYQSKAFSYARDLKKWYKEAEGDLSLFQERLCAYLG